VVDAGALFPSIEIGHHRVFAGVLRVDGVTILATVCGGLAVAGIVVSRMREAERVADLMQIGVGEAVGAEEEILCVPVVRGKVVIQPDVGFPQVVGVVDWKKVLRA
jgi:hypothetical protein